ncbi:suppressor of fused homolog [Lampetra planeri]
MDVHNNNSSSSSGGGAEAEASRQRLEWGQRGGERAQEEEDDDDEEDEEDDDEEEEGGGGDAAGAVPGIRAPPGLRAVYEECHRRHPEQPNPLQVTAIVKYWLGGPDPLDYISMYRCGGGGAVEEHWLYVSFGLSDLYGDRRVHPLSAPDLPSGFGFELTFRLKREPGETAPPTWPAELMQGLARYVFQSENRLCSGDHVSWHAPLDGHDSRLQHMLLTEDAQLQTVSSPLGTVSFLQIVGVCNEELQAAQQWNGPGVIDILKSVPGAGGPWLITDMRRGESVFEIDPQLQERVDVGVEREGSNLSGVSGRLAWASGAPGNGRRHGDRDGRRQGDRPGNGRHQGDRAGGEGPRGPRTLSHRDSAGIRAALRKGLGATGLRGVGAEIPATTTVAYHHHHHHHHNHHQLQPHSNTTNHDRTGVKMEPRDDDDDGDDADDDDDEGEEEGEGGVGGAPPPTGPVPPELLTARRVHQLHLLLNLESASLLPLALRQRCGHGTTLHLQDVTGDAAVTLVSPGVEGAVVTSLHPLRLTGAWLQVLLPTERADELLRDLEELPGLEEVNLPREFRWPEMKLAITVLPDADFDSH